VHLKSFRILNFRSINDSGVIDASRITALLGRNESGKSNLLRGLHTLNPAEGFAALNPIKDFPRHRKLSECSAGTPVVSTVWALDEDEQAELASIWPRAVDIAEVRIGRKYGPKSRWVGIDVPPSTFEIAEIKALARKIVPAVKAKAAELSDSQKAALEAAADTFGAAIGVDEDEEDWAASAPAILSALRVALAAADVELSDTQDAYITSLEDRADAIPKDEAAHAAARQWVLERLPVFLYLDDYPEIRGHQDIAAYLQRRQDGIASEADRNFQKLCKVAGLNPEQLQNLLQSNDQETRAQLANRAGSVVTTAIRKRWKDRQLKVRFNLDDNVMFVTSAFAGNAPSERGITRGPVASMATGPFAFGVTAEFTHLFPHLTP
jgi:hypothetical protein